MTATFHTAEVEPAAAEVEPAAATWLPITLVITEPADWWRIIHAGALVGTADGLVAELRHYRRHSDTLKARFTGRNGGTWHGNLPAADIVTVLVPHQVEEVAP